MKLLHRYLTAAALLLVIDLAMAQSSPPDWRLYALTDEPNAKAFFFLYSDMVRSPNGHVQVWIKTLDSKKLADSIDGVFKDHEDIVQKAADKVVASYVPPYT